MDGPHRGEGSGEPDEKFGQESLFPFSFKGEEAFFAVNNVSPFLIWSPLFIYTQPNHLLRLDDN